MAKVMVFEDVATGGAEWYSRGGVVTVRNSREIADGMPERKSILSHAALHKYHCIKFKELRSE